VVAGSALFSGSAYYDRVRAEARECDIEFPGWIDDVPAFLAGVDLLVVPSRGAEATTRVIAEAFSAGTPVLALASGGIPEVVAESEDALVAHDGSPEGLAAAMRAAMRHPQQLSDLAERARDKWRERFSVQRFQADVASAVEEAARRNLHRKPLASTGAIAEA
jgi:glycosyltransferase involved in cell wall biosynthesis